MNSNQYPVILATKYSELLPENVLG